MIISFPKFTILFLLIFKRINELKVKMKKNIYCYIQIYGQQIYIDISIKMVISRNKVDKALIATVKVSTWIIIFFTIPAKDNFT